MSEMNTEKLAEILHEAMTDGSARSDEFCCGTVEARLEGGHWFYASHVDGAEFSVAVMDRDSVASAEVAKLRRFAELVGPIITDPGVMVDLSNEEMATDEQITEMYDLAGELGVRGQ
ncbi:hypothetical protein KIH74_22530 [Kineosporia sp. J2-2]|uniref:Uncharacterized protein n=1 Tax=Kineosporia corallincola TaxID=2835133 RepID=A0ABS5TMX4_9ACTN|nr:hypothetical protein [Kineosporia corallincola]MBT0771734.1 hypothetical protein [Kineosporia corallincola]